MSSSNIRPDKLNRVLAIGAACFLGFGIGYFMVEFISTRERPPLGMTFHVIIGFLLMSVSTIILAIVLKQFLFPKKKKRKGHPPVFLNDDQKRKDGRS